MASEADSYAAFVDDLLNTVQKGLETEQSTKRAKIARKLPMKTSMTPAKRVMVARFALGADDATYLQSGLAALWTVSGKSDLELAPRGLYAADADEGIHAGLLRAMKNKHRQLQRDAPSQLQTIMKFVDVLTDVPEMAVDPGLKATVKSAVASAKLADFLSDATNRDAIRKVLQQLAKMSRERGESVADKILERLQETNKRLEVEKQAVEAQCAADIASIQQKCTDEKAEANRQFQEQSTQLIRVLDAAVKKREAEMLAEVARVQGEASAKIDEANDAKERAEEAARKAREQLAEGEADMANAIVEANNEADRRITEELERVKRVTELQIEQAQKAIDSALKEQARAIQKEKENAEAKIKEEEERIAKERDEAIQAAEAKAAGEIIAAKSIARAQVQLAQQDAQEAKAAAASAKEAREKAEELSQSFKELNDKLLERLRASEKKLDDMEQSQAELLATTEEQSARIAQQTTFIQERKADIKALKEAAVKVQKEFAEERKVHTGKQAVSVYRLAQATKKLGELAAKVKAIEQTVDVRNATIAEQTRELAQFKGLPKQVTELEERLKAQQELAQASNLASIAEIEELKKKAEEEKDALMKKAQAEVEALKGGKVLRERNQLKDEKSQLIELVRGLAEQAGKDPDLELQSAGVTSASYAIDRGLCGQRAPIERASACPTDALLPYNHVSNPRLAELMPQLRAILEEELPPELEDDADTGAAASALALLRDDYAVIAPEPASATDARGGVEHPHEVRWLPQGRNAVDMADCATLEHAAQRCLRVAGQGSTPPAERAALAAAAARLKAMQLAPLQRLHEAVAYDDDPPPLGTETRLVTRPCAVVRGVLSYPVGDSLAPLPTDASSSHFSSVLELSRAMEETKSRTNAIRNDLRRTGVSSRVYVAPPAERLAFQSAPTGVAFDPEVVESISAQDLSLAQLHALARHGLAYLDAMGTSTATFSAAAAAVATDYAAPGTAVPTQRRDALWTEFKRHVAIGGDRLWVFLRTLSGSMGGDVTEILTMADEQTVKATKALQEQRVTIAKRISDMQSKIVETVVGGMLKDSKLALDKNASGTLVVVDSAARQQLRDLASGESGRPFFEANVAMRNLTEANEKSQTKLTDMLSSLAGVGQRLQASLEETLVLPGGAGATLSELSHPANSYFVSIKPDAVTAVRVAHDRLNVELGIQGAGRRLALWELIEGGCQALSTRFAEFVGHVLVQARSSTGVSALYVSQMAIQTNALQARVSLQRLVHVAAAYIGRVRLPDFNGGLDGRKAAIDAGEQVHERDVLRMGMGAGSQRNGMYAPIHPTGWSMRY